MFGRLGPGVWAAASIAAAVVLVTSPAAVAQDPFQDAVKSASEGTDKSKAESSADKDATQPSKSKASTKAEPEFVYKTDAEWRKILTRAQFAVTREKATEPAFSGRYATGHYRGTFVCVCCKAELFSASHKFDSGTGWPSFFQAVSGRALQSAADYSDGEPRMEVMCRRCGAHLGHVFNDGPPPTGLRFCINSLSIVLKRPDSTLDSTSAGKASSNTRAKSTARMKSTAKPKTTANSKSAGRPATSKDRAPEQPPASESGATLAPAPTKDATSP
jgi:peptide-methionine (R)-S-oxide reductase